MTEVVAKQDKFKVLSILAQNDPVGFEAERKKILEEYICNAPEAHRQRLRCLQWRIDRVRDRAKTPLAACIAISEMMWDSFYQLHRLYQDLGMTKTKGRKTAVKPLRSAIILPFPTTSRAKAIVD